MPTTLATPPVSALWNTREQALAAYRSMLDSADQIQCASSVIHLHVNRLLGDTVPEPLVRALAVDLLYARQATAAIRRHHPVS
jgi:hypothetical protein